MKKIELLIVMSLVVIITYAQSSVIKITGTKFPFEIMQQWIDAYSKTHPGVVFQLSKSIPADSAGLLIAAHDFREDELNNHQIIIALNRYVQLPIANSNRTDISALQQKGFTQADFRNIYFMNQNKTDQFNIPVTVYRRDKNVCASRAFAENVVGYNLDVVGVLINDDDKALLNAVKNDPNGISYNNLSFIYDLKTRQVTEGIAVIPIDLNENGTIDSNEKIYTTLDDVLDYLGTSAKTNIPQENVNIVANKNNVSKNALYFLNWIITQGQQYNYAYGFLSLSKTLVLKEQSILNSLASDNAFIK